MPNRVVLHWSVDALARMLTSSWVKAETTASTESMSCACAACGDAPETIACSVCGKGRTDYLKR
jgi:hypothetical protein